MDLFEEMSLFDISLLTNFQKVIESETNRIEKEKEIDIAIFNHSNCQCAGEANEFSMEQMLKTEFQKNFTELGAEFLIIGLYKQCEVYFKVLVNEYQLSQSNAVKKTLYSLNDSLAHFDSINELRLINNCIKHSGVVSNSLANEYPSWNVNAPLGNLLPVYARLVTNVRRYVRDHEQYIKQYT
ncbi:hypothetical protein [Aliivibrio fischeri]|uniref:RiboL-PSP-HEPN domain-containing protein n=1 Tax=Aliivibrio fischeri TaxID=668 RepID=A0A844NXM2_ALIFS|nr:hypothetical protein [Aliivibrio fischeri]MUK48272.1 hypothetical protein [Aliivibrio fischeri]